MTVSHRPDSHRFVATTDAGDAVLTYRLDGDRIVFEHTVVPEAAEGQGVGSSLAKAGLAHARSEGLRVVPQCPFVAAYMERHPETHDLRA